MEQSYMEQSYMEQKNKIMLAVQTEFNEKGIKFIMDDIAKRMGMSKKTLYLLFEDKTALFEEMVEFTFRGIKQAQDEILNDDHLSTVDKIRRVMIADPGGYSSLNMESITQIKVKFPEIYRRIQAHLESGWEPTIDLLLKGMDEGVIRRVNPYSVKMMVEGTIEHLLATNELEKQSMTYNQALESMMDILMRGIESGRSEKQT